MWAPTGTQQHFGSWYNSIFFSGTLWLLASQIPYFPTQHLHTQNVKGIALSTNKENRTQMRRKSFAACFSHPWPSVSPQMEHPGPP